MLQVIEKISGDSHIDTKVNDVQGAQIFLREYIWNILTLKVYKCELIILIFLL